MNIFTKEMVMAVLNGIFLNADDRELIFESIEDDLNKELGTNSTPFISHVQSAVVNALKNRILVKPMLAKPMFTKNNFYSLLAKKIVKALISSSKDSVVDLRLFKGNDITPDIYSVSELTDLYNDIKEYDGEWFIDFYENIKSANSAEFLDIAVFYDDFIMAR